MKKSISILTCLFILLNSWIVFASSAPDVPEDLRGQNILLIDADSQRTIYEKNSTETINPGGFAKVLTAAIVIDNVNSLDDKVTADQAAISAYDFSYNNMGILPEETLSVEQLLYGMLIYDAGEAANVLAMHCSGSIEKFVEVMNAKVAELGCTSTNFTNPSGTPDSNQYSTLEDCAKIVDYAMEIESLANIVAAKKYTIEPTNKYRQTRHLNNTNKFVSNASTDEYYNKMVTGLKTSYVSNDDCGIAITYQDATTALTCLVAGAPYEDGTNYANSDAKKLIEYGLNYHTSVKIVSRDEILAEVKVPNGKESNKILLIAPDDLNINLPKGYDESQLSKEVLTDKKTKAPITKGDALGQLTVYYKGEKYGSTILVADQNIGSAPIKGLFAAIGAVLTSWIFITLVVGIIMLFIAYTILLNRAKRKRQYVSRFKDLR